jgi:hypothetical protein
MSALHDAFYIASGLSVVAAVASWVGMGKRKEVQPVGAVTAREAQPQVVPVIESTKAQAPSNEPEEQ